MKWEEINTSATWISAGLVRDWTYKTSDKHSSDLEGFLQMRTDIFLSHKGNWEEDEQMISWRPMSTLHDEPLRRTSSFSLSLNLATNFRVVEFTWKLNLQSRERIFLVNITDVSISWHTSHHSMRWALLLINTSSFSRATGISQRTWIQSPTWERASVDGATFWGRSHDHFDDNPKMMNKLLSKGTLIYHKHDNCTTK